jgi:hypothetical protein
MIPSKQEKVNNEPVRVLKNKIGIDHWGVVQYNQANDPQE